MTTHSPRVRPRLATIDRIRSRAIVCGVSLACWIWAAAPPAAQTAASDRAGPGGGAAVVVAPFVNLSRQADDDWIGAGILETVTAELVGSGVPVVGRATTGGGPDESPDGAAAALETARRHEAVWLITGAYQRVGTALRITAQVVDAATGAVVQTLKVDGSRDELFDVQDQVVAALRDRLADAGRGLRTNRSAAGTETPRVSSGSFPLPAAGEGRDASNGVGGDVGNPATRGAAVPPSGGGFGDPTAPTRGAAVPSSGGGLGEVNGVIELAGDPAGGPASGTARPPLAGGRSGFAAPVGERPRTVISRAGQSPRIDGRLDDAVWETAAHLTRFIQIAPVEGAPGTEDTEVWVAYDDDNLYLAFYAHYVDPGMMRANRADRDDIRGDDRMAVLFDPFLDQQRAYQFEVNGYGVQGDSIVNADGRSGSSSRRMLRPQQSGGVTRAGGGSSSGFSSSGQFGIRGDASWNTLFTTAGRIVDDGWTAEMAIPFKSLRYPAASGGNLRWGFQITRVIRGKSEAQAWAPISRGIAGQLTQFGLLEGLSGLSTSRNLEILPELVGVRLGSLEDGAFTEREPVGTAGLGVKYGITPNLTADITFNPDYSQIESDQPQIETNQRFPLFFPEQRPFFLEGQEIFQTPTITNLLHTRTIIEPRFGGKLTGKVGRTTIGVVAADDEAPGLLDDMSDPRYGTTAQTFVGRVRYDLYSESYLGAITTSREFGLEHNRVAGVDGRFRVGRTHNVSFLAVGSSTQSDAEGALSGPVIEADYTRQGRNLGYGASYSSVDPEFRTETGFLSRRNYRQATGNVSYRWWPESALLTWGPTLSYLRLYDHAGVLQDEQLQGRVSLSFRNNISLNGTISRDLERYREIDFRKNGYGVFGVVSAQRFSVVGGVNWGDGVRIIDNPFLGRATSGNILISARPSSRLRTELTGIVSRFVNPVNDAEEFDIKILRTRATYQFTTRLLLRHILEYNTAAVTLGNNVLLTYRINAGTVAFLGYDDRYRQGTLIDEYLFPTTALQRTNRAVFAKVSYLFRY